MGRKLTLVIDNDPDVENPSDEGGWKLYSFNSRHASHEDPDTFFNENGKIKSIGLRRKLQVGLAHILDYSEHGNCRWSLQGGQHMDPWDSTRCAGILIWEGKPEDIGAKTYEDRKKDAESFCETYTDWANGNCYQYTLRERIENEDEEDTEEGEEIANCGGFIGEEHLFSDIQSMTLPDDEIVWEGDGAWLEEYHDAIKPPEKAEAK